MEEKGRREGGRKELGRKEGRKEVSVGWMRK